MAPVNVTSNVTVGASSTGNGTAARNSTNSGEPPQTSLGLSLNLSALFMLGVAAVISFLIVYVKI